MSNTDQKQDGLLTKKELAKLLRVSPRKIELDPSIPSIRWGRSVRYDWPTVLAYLHEQNGRPIDARSQAKRIC